MDKRIPVESCYNRDGVSHVVATAAGDGLLNNFPDAPQRMIVYWWCGRPVGHDFIGCEPSQSSVGCIDPDLLARIRAEQQAGASPRHSASVVICTRDRPQQLQRCLASLSEQTYRPLEIVVVDNASRDQRSKDATLAAGATYIREDRAGLDIARNTGARNATADIIAYTDDDVLLHRHWLERLVAAFDEPQISAVTGLVLPAELATEAQRHFETYWSFGQGYLRQDFDAARFADHTDSVFPAWDIGAGASMAFRRTVFEQLGFFDERLDVGQAGCSGDSEFWYRLLANGYSCRYEPSAVAFHFHRRTMSALSQQIFHYMRGHAAALLVQYERTGIIANRTQALYRMPRWYGSRLWRRLRGQRSPQDRLLKAEILGYLSGLWFYFRHRRRSDVP